MSVHGANRLGTNSLVDLVVFGRRAGQHVAEYVKSADMPRIPDGAEERAVKKLERLHDGKKGPHVGPILHRDAGDHDGEGRRLPQREADGRGRRRDQKLRDTYQDVRTEDTNKAFNSDILGILELENMLDLSLITAASALNRQESRGAHSREDYPDRDDPNWLKHTLHDSTAKVSIDYKDVDTSIWEPKPRKY